MTSEKWPQYVSVANGRVVYRPRVKGDPPEGFGVDNRGFLKPPIRLGKSTDPREVILERYHEELDRLGLPKPARKRSGESNPGKVYGYSRISTNGQDADRQQLDIHEYAAKNGMAAPEVTTETISSRKEERQIFALIEGMKKGDVLIVTELSRLCRSMIELNGMIADVLRKGASIHVTTGKPVDASIESQALVFALGIASQVERDMISERTKSALRARKAEGVKLGRPKGRGRQVEQTLRDKGFDPDAIRDMAKNGLSARKIAGLVGLDARTVGAWLKGFERQSLLI